VPPPCDQAYSRPSHGSTPGHGTPTPTTRFPGKQPSSSGIASAPASTPGRRRSHRTEARTGFGDPTESGSSAERFRPRKYVTRVTGTSLWIEPRSRSIVCSDQPRVRAARSPPRYAAEAGAHAWPTPAAQASDCPLTRLGQRSSTMATAVLPPLGHRCNAGRNGGFALIPFRIKRACGVPAIRPGARAAMHLILPLRTRRWCWRARNAIPELLPAVAGESAGWRGVPCPPVCSPWLGAICLESHGGGPAGAGLQGGLVPFQLAAPEASCVSGGKRAGTALGSETGRWRGIGDDGTRSAQLRRARVNALRQVKDPELTMNIVDLAWCTTSKSPTRGAGQDDAHSPGCPAGPMITNDAYRVLRGSRA